MEPLRSEFVDVDQVIESARAALQIRETFKARQWAQRAAQLAPDREEPWLILAEIAKPPASLAYIQRAFSSHPNSPAAIRALTHLREREKLRSLEKTQPVRILQAQIQLPEKSRRAHRISTLPSLSGLIVLLAVILIGWLTWEDHIPRVSSAYFISPTLNKTTTRIPIPTATATPSPSPTAIPSPTPTDTPTASPSPSPVPPTPTPGPKSIVVDISDQKVYAYQGSQVVFSYPASTGSGNSTLTGSFSILDKDPDAYSDPWGFWMPDWMGIYYVDSDLEDGFHSLPVLSNGSTLWGDEIGTPVTYGCVVLEPANMQALFQWADVGTPVTIWQ